MEELRACRTDAAAEAEEQVSTLTETWEEVKVRVLLLACRKEMDRAVLPLSWLGRILDKKIVHLSQSW